MASSSHSSLELLDAASDGSEVERSELKTKLTELSGEIGQLLEVAREENNVLLGRIDQLEEGNRDLRGEVARLSRKGTLRGRIYMKALENGNVTTLSSWTDDNMAGLEWTASVKLEGDSLLSTVKILGIETGTRLKGSFSLSILSNGKPLKTWQNESLTYVSSDRPMNYSIPLAKFKDSCEKAHPDEANGAWGSDYELRVHVRGTIEFRVICALIAIILLLLIVVWMDGSKSRNK